MSYKLLTSVDYTDVTSPGNCFAGMSLSAERERRQHEASLKDFMEETRE